jgi:AcrR family transcriptional regulator
MGIAERREREKAQRRLDIVRAAEKVFLSKGYDAATMDEIAEEAELGKATLYLYFKGKEDVHRQIVAKGMDVLFDLINHAVDPKSNGMSKLQAIWDSFMRFSVEHIEYSDALIHYESKEIDIGSEEEFEKWLRKYKVINFLMATIKEGMADKSIRRDVESGKMTLLFWAQVIGAVQFLKFKRALIKNLLNIEPEEFLKYFKEFFFDHLRPQ